ncbi:hypothetical protein [Streptacidiphilus sp. EB103A]|uniref:hypothetical protein n=1 Tax=Streptacidiphilus sp. EB103A TaxID=3156275 RepID=UPI003512C7FE
MPKADTHSDPLKEAADAAQELADALKLAEFTLPSLRRDFPVAGRPLVQLGGAPADLVRQLAAWVRERA